MHSFFPNLHRFISVIALGIESSALLLGNGRNQSGRFWWGRKMELWVGLRNRCHLKKTRVCWWRLQERWKRPVPERVIINLLKRTEMNRKMRILRRMSMAGSTVIINGKPEQVKVAWARFVIQFFYATQETEISLQYTRYRRWTRIAVVNEIVEVVEEGDTGIERQRGRASVSMVTASPVTSPSRRTEDSPEGSPLRQRLKSALTKGTS